MKTLFSVGFQSQNPFTLQHPGLAGAPSLGRAIPLRQAAFMGQDTTEFEHLRDAEAQANSDMRDKLSTIIAQGTPKAAQVRAWIAGQAAKDPTLLSTFKEQYVVNNWHGYEDIINTDQASVDLAAQKIASPDQRNWSFSDDMIGRVQEWNQVLDIMVAGMQEYGNVKPIIGPVKQGPLISVKTGAPVPSSIAPGAKLTTPPPSTGVSTNTLLVGGGIVAATIAVILAMRA
jgi:hypothetical protein